MSNAAEKLVAKNLYKVFGSQSDQAFEMLESGKSRSEILERTGATVAVRDISFSVSAGEIFVVMGLSGSGKSTLVRMLNRLVDPSRGSVSVDGESVTRCSYRTVRDLRLRKMAMVFQNFALFPHMTVLDNAAYGLRVQGVGRKERNRTAMRALTRVGLDRWANVAPDALSGGMQQRVGLARGLAVSPDILLMDEPFSALDPLIRRDMQLELLALQRDVQQTIVFITHDLHEALTLGDRIAIMNDGEFVQVGTAQEIVANPADDYVAAFTREIDRGRVFSAGYAMAKAEPLNASSDSRETALRRMQESGRSGLHVVDGRGIAGVVTRADVMDHSNDDGADLMSVVRRDFPTASTDDLLCELYEQCTGGMPIAVVDGGGALVGALEPGQVFQQLSGRNGTGQRPTNGFVATDRQQSRGAHA